MKDEKLTYQRLMRNTIRQIAALKPDSDAKLRDRLNKKFNKYAKKAGMSLGGPTQPKNGTPGNQDN